MKRVDGSDLEEQLHAQLDLTRRAKAGNLAEGSAGDAGCGVVPVTVIHDVEEFGAEVQFVALADIEAPAERKIPLDGSGAKDRETPEITEGARRLNRERRGVEPLENSLLRG